MISIVIERTLTLLNLKGINTTAVNILISGDGLEPAVYILLSSEGLDSAVYIILYREGLDPAV